MKELICALMLLPSLTYAKASNTGTSNGRFQLIQLSDMRRDQYLLDTQTGKMWTPNCISGNSNDCDYSAWLQVDIDSITISSENIFKKAARIEDLKKPKEQK